MTKFKNILEQYHIHPKRYMGQNFLIDKSVLQKIIDAANLSSDDTVLEIGPGLGILTIELAKRVKRVIAIEKDKRMCGVLQKILAAENIKNVEIINTDILKMNIDGLSNYKIVANLPYYITSPVIRKFLEAPHPPSLMILMIQKEVAQRICAKPPKMSILSVAVQLYVNPEIIDYIPKNCFYPQPKVDSAIIKLVPKQIPKINTEKFFKLIRAGFSSKRKFLINNLSRELKIVNCKLKIVFEQIGLAQKCRAENLSINDWLKLFHSQTLY